MNALQEYHSNRRHSSRRRILSSIVRIQEKLSKDSASARKSVDDKKL
jgi:hypothetical protein